MKWDQIDLFEEWLPVVGLEGQYEVSNVGRVRSLARVKHFAKGSRRLRGKILRPWLGKRYLMVGLIQQKPQYVHVLVAAAFIGPRPAGKEIDHIDRNCLNNAASNLRYLALKENRSKVGEENGSAKLTWQDINEIRRLSIEGVKRSDLRKQFRSSKSQIGRIVRGESWRVKVK